MAVFIGFGVAGAAAWLAGGASGASVAALFRLGWSAVLLGTSFLAIGYAVSAVARSSSAAAGLAIGIWILFVVLYDLGLLGALVYDNGGSFTEYVFPVLLTANPADAFRIFNLSGSGNTALAAGLTGATSGLPLWAVVLSLFGWPLVVLGLARLALKRVEP
jgi:Cu-processing system permease protein